MKPVAIFRHSNTEGPGYFATYLDRCGIQWNLVRVDESDPVPSDPSIYAGLVFMGGPMSVNDDLPWIEPVLTLIRTAVQREVPTLGHCLGGQLMSKALGGVVTRNRVKEIGWGEVKVSQFAPAKKWFGESTSFLSFHWHGETFSIPPGATGIAASQYCENQAFAIGPHLGMQCHVEMTPDLIRAWCRDWHKEVTSLSQKTPSVQSPEEIQFDLDTRVKNLNAVADVIYGHWIKGLSRD